MLINSNSCNVQPMDRTLGMPGEGPKMVPVPTDFTLNDSYEVDLSNFVQMGRISMVQSIYVDNADGAVAITILVELGSQRLIVPAGEQAYLPILVPNPIKLTISSPGGASSAVVFLINFPIPPELWGAGSAAAQTISPEWTAVSVNADTLVPDSVIDMRPYMTGNWTFFNQGPGDVTLELKGANRPDLLDEVNLFSGPITGGSFITENFSPGFVLRFQRVFMHSTVADTPGTVLAGGYFSLT